MVERHSETWVTGIQGSDERPLHTCHCRDWVRERAITIQAITMPRLGQGKNYIEMVHLIVRVLGNPTKEQMHFVSDKAFRLFRLSHGITSV